MVASRLPSIAQRRDQVLPPQTDHELGGVPFIGRFAALVDEPNN